MTMRDILKITINLTVICLLAGLILSLTWARTDPVKVKAEADEKEMALKRLAPAAETILPIKDIVIAGKDNVIYEARAGGNVVGYVVSSSGRGYSSFIKLLVAADKDCKVTGIDILGHGETPGLGDQIDQDWFKGQFKGKGVESLVVVKGETKTDVQAISGATISSKGVTKGVRDALEKLKEETLLPSLERK